MGIHIFARLGCNAGINAYILANLHDKVNVRLHRQKISS